MKKATFFIKTGVPDIDDDIIMPGALRIPDKPIRVLKDFDTSFSGIVGQCTVSESDGLIKIDADINEDFPLEHSTHGIGYRLVEFDVDKNGNKIIKAADLYCVGLVTKEGHE